MPALWPSQVAIDGLPGQVQGAEVKECPHCEWRHGESIDCRREMKLRSKVKRALIRHVIGDTSDYRAPLRPTFTDCRGIGFVGKVTRSG